MYLLRISVAVVSIIFCIEQLTAQALPRPISGGPGSSVGVGSSGGPSLSGATIPTGTAPVYSGDSPHPMLLTGKVTLQDGSQPGMAVLIERICLGRPHPEGYTDAKGSFSITLGQEMGMLADASEASTRNTVTAANPEGGVKDNQLVNCDLRAVMVGYRSDLVSLSSRKYMDNPDVGTIVMRRLANVEGLTVSATNELAPKDAQKCYTRGLDALKKNKRGDAEREFEKAIEIYPKYAGAWFELGVLRERGELLEEARYAYAQSIAADPKFLNPSERMYLLAFKQSKWREVAEYSDRVLHLDPVDYPGAYYYNAIAYLQLGNLAAAEKSARQSVALDTRGTNPQSMYVLGVILARRRDFSGAAENLRAYLKADPDGKESERARKQVAELDRMLASAVPAAK